MSPYTFTATTVEHAAFLHPFTHDEALRYASWCRGSIKERPDQSERLRAVAFEIEAGVRQFSQTAKAIASKPTA